jgi:hypothetical protein
MKRPSLARLVQFPPWKAGVLGLVCALAVTSIVRATIPDASGVIHGCYAKSGSAIYVIDAAVTTCKNGDTALAWNEQGPSGPVGPTGPTGATGPTGPIGPSDAFLKDDQGSFSSQNLDGNDFKDIDTLSQLPAGSYVFNATLTFVGGMSFATVQCILQTGDNHFLSSAVQSTVGGSANSFGTMTIGSAATFAATTDVKTSCRSSGVASSQPSSLTAIRVATLTKQQ